jgi:tetratricopeptide (TPR) repeat protein
MSHLLRALLKPHIFLFVPLLISFSISAQTFTMGRECRAKNTAAIAMLKEKKYQEALDAFTAMEKSCKTKDAKEATAVGKAEALNGLEKYDEAIKASDAALKVTKNKSLSGYFQKAYAQNKLGQHEASKETFTRMIALTEKNENTKARASNYATLSAIEYRQLNEKDSAYFYLDKAMQLDSTNTNFYIQKGDMLNGDKKYDNAFTEYDKAVAMGRNDVEMYKIRTDARMRMLQDKYGTNNTQELRGKMTAQEKEQVCAELTKAIELGLRDMKYDMFSQLVCK